MVEDQDPVEGGVGVSRRWDSAMEGLEGGGLPGPFSSPLTLRENILDEGGRGSRSFFLQHCRQDFEMNMYENPKYVFQFSGLREQQWL